jgi:hypothetical protein
MNDETIDYLDMAMDVMSHDFDGFDEIVAACAAIAQAQALTRIAECLTAITDDMVQTKRTLREWEGEL